MIFNASLIYAFLSLASLEASKDYLSSDPQIAQSAFEEILENKNRKALTEVIRESNFQSLRLKALNNLEVNNPEEIGEFLSLLEFHNQSYPYGGLQQESAKKIIMEGLSEKIADATHEPLPNDYSRNEVEKFIELVRFKIGNSFESEGPNNNYPEQKSVAFPKKDQPPIKHSGQSDKDSKPFSSIYLMLGPLILAGLAILIWNSRKGSSAS